MNDPVKEIKSQISPAEAIERYTGQQARHGKYICPFHNDKHPSLSVKGSHWRCWSCDEHGDVIDFTTRYFGISFQEAINKLADDYSIPIQRFSEPVTDPLEKLWNAIQRETNEYNKEQVRIYRKAIDDQINDLTTAHRILLQHGAPDEMLDRYAAEIDELIDYRARI